MKGKEATITGNETSPISQFPPTAFQTGDGPGIRIHLPDGKQGTTVYGDSEHDRGHSVLYGRLNDILKKQEEANDED